MNIQKYLSSLLPTFSKSRITGDLNDVKAELIQLTLPPLKTMVETLNQTKFSNEWADDVNSMFKSRSPVKFRGLFINAVYEILVGMEKNIPVNVVCNALQPSFMQHGAYNGARHTPWRRGA